MSFTDDEIRAGVAELEAYAAANGLTEAQFVKLVADEAVKREIPLQRLADATVYDENDINSAIARANAEGAGINIPGDLQIKSQNNQRGANRS